MSNETRVCGWCSEPSDSGMGSVEDRIDGDHYHQGCWETVADRTGIDLTVLDEYLTESADEGLPVSLDDFRLYEQFRSVV